MFEKETFRLIARSFRRFLSLVMIVFIGSGFLMGLSSTPDVLRESVDEYYDAYDMNDIILYSPYGFCKEDYEKISTSNGIETVFASKEIDCHGVNTKGDETVFRVSEVDRGNTRYKLIKGRLPEYSDECIFLSNGNMERYDIGDVITLKYGEEDIGDYLSNDRYTIVGIFESPQFMSKIFGNSNYKNEQLECAICIPNGNFISDYYTTMYITLMGAKDTLSNSDQYDRFIKDNKVLVENIAFEQQSFLRDRLVKEASEELEENEKLFEQMRSDGQKQLDEARKQLDDAKIQIITYEAQLSTLQTMIDSLKAAIKADSEILSSIYGLTVDVEDDINNILELFGQNGIHYASGTMEYLYGQYNDAIAQFDSLKGAMDSAKVQYESGLREYEEGLSRFNEEIAEGEKQLKLARARLNDLPASKWIILDRDLQYSTLMFKNTCDQMGVIGLYMPVMFFLVGALVCLTTMKRLVDEQRGQIGIYTALGYSNLKIISKYVLYALYASLSGGILGVIFGQIVFPAVIYDTWRILYYFPEQKFLFPPELALLSIGSFAVLMAAITAYVVNDSIKDVPASLMRPIAPKKGKEIILEKIPFLWNILSFTSKITARNIFRYKSRFLMTIAGIAGCTGLLILGFGIKDSVSDVLGIQYEQIFKYDSLMYFSASDNLEENLEILKESDAVDYASIYQEYVSKVYIENGEKTANVGVIAPADYNVMFGIRETDKKTPIRLNNDGVIVSELFAKNNHLKIGDYITIESGNRIRGEVKIVNICEMYFQHYIFMSDVLYRNTFDDDMDGNIIIVLSDDNEAVKQLTRSLKDFVSFVNTSYFLDAFNNMIEALNLVIMVIILVAGSLAFVVIVNLTQVNISERIREIATLKVLGFNDHEVNMYIFKEILLLSVIGCFVGIPIGIVEHRFIMNVISMEMIMFARTINLSSYAVSFVITISFTIIVLLFMRRPLRKVDMVESLKSVE